MPSHRQPQLLFWLAGAPAGCRAAHCATFPERRRANCCYRIAGRLNYHGRSEAGWPRQRNWRCAEDSLTGRMPTIAS